MKKTNKQKKPGTRYKRYLSKEDYGPVGTTRFLRKMPRAGQAPSVNVQYVRLLSHLRDCSGPFIFKVTGSKLYGM